MVKHKKIGYLGAGTWGVSLAELLAKKGHQVIVWSRREELVHKLNETKEHPHLKNHHIQGNIRFTSSLKETVEGADFLVESVTSSGIRPVFTEVKKLTVPLCPMVLTSKGIEQGTGLLLTDVVVDILGEEYRQYLGYLSGPSHAEEVIREMPTSVVCSAFEPKTTQEIQKLFTTDKFRVYPNQDIKGVEFGGAMKNIIAIACGLSDGLGFGDNSKAALMTRGLHEIRKLAIAKGCRAETINGLAGMGDLCVTCISLFSRNYRFGNLIAKGRSVDEAKQEIGMVVEGTFACRSVLEISKEVHVPLPITEAIYQIVYENLPPKEAVKCLLDRVVKEEHL
jgi:glycerol-3-phosphate dehydrogenase (NAD(P)+)